jgi:RimJ/RimL family protein N-acetyltransferase
MAFGPTMKIKTDRLEIELAPFTREQALLFVGGFEKHSVTQYLSAGIAQTKETEEEWYDTMIKDKASRVWGIWIIEDGKRILIGSSSLMNLVLDKHIRQATSGSLIFNTTHWGKGIASTCHKARALFAFEQLGLHRIMSAVLQPNVGSRKALERSGYTFVYTERNEEFVNGNLVHKDCFECLNPADWAWRQWWGDDRPPRKNVDARKCTEDALEWARTHVSFT